MSPKKTIYPPLQKGTYLLIIVLEYKHLEKCCFIVETREQETYCKGTRAFKILYGQGTRQDLWYVHISYTLVFFFLFFFFLFMYVRSIEVLVCEFSYGIHSNNSTMYIWKVMCTVHKYTDLNQHRSSRSQGPNLSQLLGELWSSIPLVYTYICIQITYMNMK